MFYRIYSSPRLVLVSFTHFFVVFSHGCRRATADPINITIDDAYGDAVTNVVPTYIPASGAWNQGANCTGCLAQPDATQAKDGTWHDATWAPGGSKGDAYSIDIMFNGSAIYVYGILANNIRYATTLTNLSFVLDGDTVGYFVHIPTASPDYEYNVLLYGNSTISTTPNDQHNLVINTVGTTNNSLILFDYAMRTFDIDTASNTTKHRSANRTSITTSVSAVTVNRSQQTFPVRSRISVVGGVVGGIVGLAICLLVAFCIFRRRWQNMKSQSNSSSGRLRDIEPFTMQQENMDSLGPESIPNVNAHSIIHSRNGSSIGLLTDVSRNHKLSEDNTISSNYVTTSYGRHFSTDSRQRKEAVAREELTRQVEEMQRAIVLLQTRLQSSSEEQPRTTEDDSQVIPDLRRHIMILQNEVERLQASQEELLRGRNNVDAPPEYDENL